MYPSPVTLPKVPRYWWNALLIWWVVCAVSVGIAWLLAPKQYTASARLLVNPERIPWQGFRASRLPTYDPDEEDLRSLMKDQGFEQTGLVVWQEPLFTFLMDQLAFDAYDFRPFLFSRETTLEAVRRSGHGKTLGLDEKPPDLLAMELTAGLEAELDKIKQELTISFTSESPEASEAVLREYILLLDDAVNRVLDEKDHQTLDRIDQRVAELRVTVAQLDADFTAFSQRETITRPTKVLEASIRLALTLRERAARQEAIAEAAGYYLDALEAGAESDPETTAGLPRILRPGPSILLPQIAEQTRSDLLNRLPLTPRRPLVIDPTLTTLRDELSDAVFKREQDALVFTPEHPKMTQHDERIAGIEARVLQEFRQLNAAQGTEYAMQEVLSTGYASGYTLLAEELEGRISEYPAYERELIDKYREYRLGRALLRKMEELQQMTVDLLEKREAILLVLDPPDASLQATEPNLLLLIPALFGIGTLAALGWLGFRDQLVV